MARGEKSKIRARAERARNADRKTVDAQREPGKRSPRRLIRYGRTIVERFIGREFESLNRLEYSAAWVGLLVRAITLRFGELRIPQRAAGLAFNTALSIVPVLVLFIAIVNALGLLEDASDNLLDVLFRAYVPVDEGTIRPVIEGIVEQAGNAYLGSIGLAFFVYTAVMLFNEVDHLFNDAWEVEERRPFFRRLMLFWTMLTLAPALITGSVVVTTRFQVLIRSQIGQIGVIEWLIPAVFPIVLTALAFFIAIMFFPNKRVQFKPAIIASIVTAIVFEAGKAGFAFYVAQFASVSWFRIYGAVFLVPVMLLWIYVSWLVICVGVVFGYCLQNFDDLVFDEEPSHTRYTNGIGLMAVIEMAVVLASAFERAEGAIRTRRVARLAGLSNRDGLAILNRFEEIGVAERIVTAEDSEDAWHLLQPASNISLGALLDECGAFDLRDEREDPTDGDAVFAARERLELLAERLRKQSDELVLSDLTSAPELD